MLVASGHLKSAEVLQQSYAALLGQAQAENGEEWKVKRAMKHLTEHAYPELDDVDLGPIEEM